MTAASQVPMTQKAVARADRAAARRRAVGTVVAVIAIHVVVLLALAVMTPKQLPVSEPPKPIAVRFVQVVAPKTQPAAKPKVEPKPKTTFKPKKVKVVKPQPKPKVKPKTKPKTDPVLTTTTTSTQTQTSKLETLTQTEITTRTTTEQTRETKKETQQDNQQQQEKKTENKQARSDEPVRVEGVSYIKPPIFNVSDRELKGEARMVRVKIFIAASGRVSDVQIVNSSGLAALDQKIARALKKAVFTPHRIDGVAVPSYTVQPVELNLSQ